MSSPRTTPPGRRSLFPRAQLRRALFALLLLGACELIGTVGFHQLEGFRWVDSFYEESMLATGQGPAITLTHDTSKVFASVLAFISLGSTLTTIVFALGPLVGRFWHEARLAAEREAERIERDLGHGFQELRFGRSPPGGGEDRTAEGDLPPP